MEELHSSTVAEIIATSPTTSKIVLGDRFWSKVHKTDGCWLWTAFKDPKGYGKFMWNSIQRLAHRLAYEEAYGDIPPKLCVCHKCDNPSCVRPDHMFIGSPKDNVHDAIKKGRHKTPNLGKTICKRGHSLMGDRVGYYVNQKKGRNYRVCLRCLSYKRKLLRVQLAAIKKAARTQPEPPQETTLQTPPT